MDVKVIMTNDELLTGLKGRDISGAVGALYRQYFFTVKKLIIAKGGNEQDSSDIFQESVLVLIELIKTGKFREESEIKTFLNSIAKNLWLRELRTRKRRNDREINYESGNDENEYDIHDHILDKETSLTLGELFELIGHRCKEILRGFYYDNMSMKELMKRFEYENEQVLRNKKSLCMKKIKSLLQSNQSLNDRLKTLLVYGK